MATTRAKGKNVCKYESLAAMNSNTAKFANWIVQVRKPEAKEVKFVDKNGKEQKGSRFQCLLTSADETEYCLGSIPFQWKNRDAGFEAGRQFIEGSVWQISTPAFDPRVKLDQISTPVKQQVMMCPPTQFIKLEGHDDNEAKKNAWPSGNVHVVLNMQQTIDQLRQVRLSTPSGYGGNKDLEQTKAMDICGTFIQLGDLTTVKKQSDGSELKVADLTLADDSGVNFKVAVWTQEAYDKFKDLQIGAGISILGCSATKDKNSHEWKMNCWPRIIVLEGGRRAQQLTELSGDAISANRIATAQFIPNSMSMDVTGKEAVPVSATALLAIPEDASSFPVETVWQLNRATVRAPTLESDITTKSGDRLWVLVNIHDWTGCTTVYVTDQAAPALYGCDSTDEVLTKARAKELQVLWTRFNMRGVLRLEEGKMRKYVVELAPSPKSFQVSSATLRCTRGLAPVLDNVAQAAPADRVTSNAMMGMCLLADNSDGSESEKQMVPCFRAFLLVTGTESTEMRPLIAGIADLEKQEYIVTSKNVKCLLSDTDVDNLDLECYCGWNDSLNYRLDKETAIVRISELKKNDQGRLSASVEHIDKVSKADLSDVRQAMTIEWKTALTKAGATAVDSHMSPYRADFFENPARKVRRVNSDPQSPLRA